MLVPPTPATEEGQAQRSEVIARGQPAQGNPRLPARDHYGRCLQASESSGQILTELLDKDGKWSTRPCFVVS